MIISKPAYFIGALGRAKTLILAFFAALLASFGMCQFAYAQAGPYQNTSSTALDETVAPCAGTHLIRTINVADSFLIADVDLGLLITHTYRGDLQITLTSPSSTTVSLVTNNGGLGSDNYNVIFDDAAGNDVNTAPHTGADGTSAPPYENTVRPLGNMSDFNGENAFGDWDIDMCDFYNADSGDFQRANLYFTEFDPTAADLSASISPSSTSPTEGTNVVLTYDIDNAGPVAATGVSATITLPSGLTYVSDNAGGDYNSGTGLWTVPGSIASSGTASFQITAFVELSGAYNTTIDVTSSAVSDPDSTPGNVVTSEDDYDTVTLSPVTPPFPSLLCPGAASVLDWDIQVWPANAAATSYTNSYTIDGEAIVITVTDTDLSLVNNASFGGQTPAENTTFTGGYSPVQSNLALYANQPLQASTVDVDIDLGTYGSGVSKFQMTIFDIDTGTQFEDQIGITGTLGGVAVTPTVTTGSSNSFSGGNITGTGGSNSNSGNGNATIEFNSPIDNLALTYGNGSGAPAAPGNQAIGLHDIFFCPPTNAVLTAQKTTEVFDPLAAGLYAVPGNDVIYTIEFTNTGSGAADVDSIEIIDAMPSEISYYNGDIDDGGPELNPVIGIDSGSGLTFTYPGDVRFSNSLTKPANFAACGYSPDPGYDPDVNFICLNPKGAMAAGAPDPSFAFKFRAGIN